MARNIFSRQVWKLTQRGFPIADAKRIAYRQQVNAGNLIPWTYQLTEEWKEYSNLFSEKRAYLRKQKYMQNAKDKKQTLFNKQP